jgi:hypothetical protein
LEKVQSLRWTGDFLISLEDGAVTGCVYVEMKGDRSYLGLLAVDSGVQKSGLGSKLISATEDHCRKKGSRSMDIQIVNLREELPDSIIAVGFSRPVRAVYYRLNTETAMPLRENVEAASVRARVEGIDQTYSGSTASALIVTNISGEITVGVNGSVAMQRQPESGLW